MPKPETSNQDFGKIIFPSMNLAIAQKIIQAVSPMTKSKPLEVSTGKVVKGKQKTGSKTITMNNDKDESLSNIFERMGRLYYMLIIKCNKKLDNDVDKSVFYVNYFFDSFTSYVPTNIFV